MPAYPGQHGKKPDTRTVGGRVAFVRGLIGAIEGRYSLEDLARDVSEAIRREAPYAGSTVQRWEEGAEPPRKVLEAISVIAKRHGLNFATPTWMLFGGDEASVTIELPVAKPKPEAKRRRA